MFTNYSFLKTERYSSAANYCNSHVLELQLSQENLASENCVIKVQKKTQKETIEKGPSAIT